jgi:cytochrome c oxidase cbb3-type subunit 3
MSNNDTNPQTDHTYDGITEYDNPTPGWWTWIFVATIAFSVVYFIVVTLAQGELGPRGFFARAKAEAQRQLVSQLGPLEANDETILRLSTDETWLPVGQSIFAGNCASCHGREGEGISAPNLTDDYFINVAEVKDIANIIEVGRKNGAMPAWRNRLEPSEIIMASAYVASLRGKNAAGRAPEGDKRPAWVHPTAQPAGSPATPATPAAPTTPAK